MITDKIKYKGIARAASDQDIQDGWLDELINLRHRDEKLQPVGHPTKLHNLPSGTFLSIWNHVQDDINNFIGLTDSYELRLIDMELGSSELIKAYSGNVDIVFLKRFMIVIYDEGTDRYLWKNEEYKLITITQEPVFSLSTADETYINKNDDLVTTAEGVLGKYFARLNTLSGDNLFTGGLMFRSAYKLFDGSYILHTLPYFLSVNNHLFALHRAAGGKYRIEFYAAKAKITFNADEYKSIKQDDGVTLTGTNGTANITVGGLTKLATFDTDLIQTMINFATDYAEAYLEIGIIVESDGSEIMFTAQTAGIGFTSPVVENVTGDLSGTVWNYHENYSGIDRSRDIIQSITLFATKAETLLEISEDTINEEKIEENKYGLHDYSWYYLNNDSEFDVSENFKNLPDSPSWYKVGEYSLSGILDGTVTEEKIDLEDFYQDYATRETMPVDQFSHHSLTSNFAMNYNSRLILADTKQTLAVKTVYEHPADELVTTEDGLTWTLTKQSGTADLAIKFIIDTESGEKDVWKYQTVNIWSSNPYMFEENIVFQGIIGYPDKRARECKIYVLDDGIYKRLISLKLTASKYMNYAYYHTDKFNSGKYDLIGNMITGGALWNFNMIWLGYYRTGLLKLPVTNPLNTEIPPDNEIIDTNRIQISEVNNPFYYPAENSYQVGTGTILACATNTEPLSTGQYGEYPLIVFTTKGIWTLFQGQGDVLFSSVKPLNGEVAISKDQIISTGTGVTYSTERGLYLIEGRTVTVLTQLLRGLPNLDIQAVNNYILRLNHINLVQLVDSLSLIDAKGYTLGAKTGFDKKNNELYVTNNNYNYSYVFSFESKLWHKTSESYRILVNSYPELLGLHDDGSNDGVFSVSQDSFVTPVTVMLTTRPCKLDGEVNFTLLHRAIQRCKIETPESVYAGFYVFGSNNLKTWQLLAGNDRKTGKVTDIYTTRTHLKVKYYILLFASILKENSTVNTLEIQYYPKIDRKIR